MNKKNHIYRGIVQPKVQIDGEQLPIEYSLNVKNHSPDGFAWGYWGSGPSQLGLAIMLLETEDEETALKYYQEFTSEVIGKLNIEKGWTLTSTDVQAWLKEKIHEGKLRQPAKGYVQGEVTPCDCYMRGLELNEIALKEKKLQAVDMDHLRSNMHMMKGLEFVAWFIDKYGHVLHKVE